MYKDHFPNVPLTFELQLTSRRASSYFAAIKTTDRLLSLYEAVLQRLASQGRTWFIQCSWPGMESAF